MNKYTAHDLVHHEDKYIELEFERDIIVKQLEAKEFQLSKQRDTVAFFRRKVLKDE